VLLVGGCCGGGGGSALTLSTLYPFGENGWPQDEEHSKELRTFGTQETVFFLRKEMMNDWDLFCWRFLTDSAMVHHNGKTTIWEMFF